MPKFKLEILLPLYHNSDQNDDRKKIDGDEFSETYKDLMKQFHACTMVPYPVSGGWTDNDTRTEITDELVVYWVIYEDTEENVGFLTDFKKVLEKRFKQKKILMYYVSVTEF